MSHRTQPPHGSLSPAGTDPAWDGTAPDRTTPPPIELRARVQRKAFTLDVDLELPGQGVTVLFGPSGSGKTTCLRVLAGLEPQAQARVVVDGQIWQTSQGAPTFVKPHQRPVGYVFQEASLFEHLSVRDNLRYGWRRTPEQQRRHDWDHGLALLGIGHLLKRRPGELSGGERQRVAIARALACSPRVLLMDEPLAALDAARKAEVLPWLDQLRGALDLPMLYVTHSLDEALRLADHMVLLDNGHVKAQGPVHELIARKDLLLAQPFGQGALLAGRVVSVSEGLLTLEIEGKPAAEHGVVEGSQVIALLKDGPSPR